VALFNVSRYLAHLSKVPPDSALGALVRAPLKFIPHEAIVRVRSGVNSGARWIAGSSNHGCWLGHYELEKQRAMVNVLAPGMTVMDIGANAGFYTLACSRLVGTEGRVWAFEPFADNARNLLRHVELNGLSNVTVIQAAVGRQSEVKGFVRASSNAMGRVGNDSRYLVPAVAIDSLRRERSIPVPAVIKIDVEGGEAEVLEGARSTLCEGRSIVFLALHGREPERDCRKLLGELGYAVTYLDGRPALDDPFNSDEVIAVPHSPR
jgi:FkbM family methyltransferase